MLDKIGSNTDPCGISQLIRSTLEMHLLMKHIGNDQIKIIDIASTSSEDLFFDCSTILNSYFQFTILVS